MSEILWLIHSDDNQIFISWKILLGFCIPDQTNKKKKAGKREFLFNFYANKSDQKVASLWLTAVTKGTSMEVWSVLYQAETSALVCLILN